MKLAKQSSTGFVTIEFLLAIGLIFLPITFVVFVFPVWIERLAMGRSAAREAARVMVLADNWDDGFAKVQQARLDTANNYGLDPGRLDLDIYGSDGDHDLERDDTVTARVTVRFPVIPLPTGDVGVLPWEVRHSERVDKYRSFP